jgi:hypothetical protein
MKAIALYERNPSSNTTGRHHNTCLPNKSASQYLTVGRLKPIGNSVFSAKPHSCTFSRVASKPQEPSLKWKKKIKLIHHKIKPNANSASE